MKLTEKQIEELRERKRKERQQGEQRNARGQPKLGGRIESMLGRIKRAMEP